MKYEYEDICVEDIYIVWSNFRYHAKHIMYIHTTIIIDESIIEKILWQGRSQKKRNKSTTYNHKER